MRKFIAAIFGLFHFYLANLSSDNTASATSLPFHRRPTFSRITFDIPLNFSNVYGKIEPIGSEWFVLFELDHHVFPSTYPAINEEIQADDHFAQCRRFDAVREVEIELELDSSFVRLRAGNSERYEFLESVGLGHEFDVSVYVQEFLDGPLCSIAVNVEQLETSRFSLPVTTASLPLIVNSAIGMELGQKTPSRRMLPNVGTVTQRSRSWTEKGKVRFATYKIQKMTTMPSNGHLYIDIQKDKEVYNAVQRSRTKEINNVWSTTFLVFLTIEVIVISCFVAFALIIFVLLQIRPKTNKHIEIVF